MQQDIFAAHDSLSGKMSPEPTASTADETLLSWLAKWLDAGYVYREMDGEQPELVSDPTDSSNGAAWTRNTSEWNHSLVPSRSGGVVCSLSSILETGPVDPRYYLSPRACAGILRRAEKRGKKLPLALRVALTNVAARGKLDEKRNPNGGAGHGARSGHAKDGTLVPVAFDTTQVTSAANYSNPQPGDPCHPLTAGAHAPCIAFHNRQDPDISGDVTNPIGRGDNGMAVAFQERGRSGGPELEIGGEVAYALTAPSGGGRAQERNILTPTLSVRRLTTVECERLQGFPDGFTAIPWRNKSADQCPDGPRYKALGNSMAVNVMQWLGQRIQMVSELEEAA